MINLVTMFGLGIDKVYAASGARDAFNKYCSVLHGGCGSGSIGGKKFLAWLANNVGDFFGFLVAGGAVIAIIYGAISIGASGGDDTRRENGKKAIIYALIGLILAIAAEAIISFISNFVGSI
tara:strand:+ start:887 stop:1252 length:366 start_codon:yes stop_codon:yes gene_type:complete